MLRAPLSTPRDNEPRDVQLPIAPGYEGIRFRAVFFFALFDLQRAVGLGIVQPHGRAVALGAAGGSRIRADVATVRTHGSLLLCPYDPARMSGGSRHKSVELGT